MKTKYDLDQLDYKYENYQCKIEEIDYHQVKAHNARYKKSHQYHLHVGMRPCPFEGDISSAQVIFLLANPHYLDGESNPIDHQRIDGWGLWGLKGTTGPALQGWWRPRLRSLVNDSHDEREWQELSNKVASFQAIGWASQNFHKCNLLPSKQLLGDALLKLARERPEVLFVVMRQRNYWGQILSNVKSEIITTKNPRCSFISLRNFNDPKDWQKLSERVGFHPKLKTVQSMD